MSLTVTPTGIIGLSLKNLRATIAASATFRTVVGAATEEDAKAKIVIAATQESDATQAVPRCIIRPLNDNEYGPRNIVTMRSSNSGYRLSVPMQMFFEFGVPPAYRDNLQDAYLDHYNKIGAIIVEMWQAKNSDPATYLGQLSSLEWHVCDRMDPDKRSKADMAIGSYLTVEFDG